MGKSSIKRWLAVLLVLVMTIAPWNIPSRTAYAASKPIKRITLKIGSKNVTKKIVRMNKGEIKKLKVSVKPASSKKSIAYKSSNPQIVKISNKGILLSKKAGTAKITVTVKGKKGASKRTWVKIKVPKKKAVGTNGDTSTSQDYGKNVSSDTGGLEESDYANGDDPDEIIVIVGNGDDNSTDGGSNQNGEAENNSRSNVRYTVSFNSNGGSWVSSQTVKEGEYAVKPTDPKKDDYVFGGWYTSEDYSQEFNFQNTSITRDIVLFAKWIEDIGTAERYSYEIIPLMMPFNEYFYIKTDNPDPASFQFVDEVTKYSETGSIVLDDTVYADVQYENLETKRVKGGYIEKGRATDGGVMKLRAVKASGSYRDTNVTVQVAEVMDIVDYLITTYGDSSKSYFDNLSGIQSGFSSECLYSSAYVLGEQKKSTTSPYYSLSTSPHIDQNFYIQDPYYRTDSKAMFVSALYPMIADSLGFPSIMKLIAKKLDSTADVQWSSTSHYLIDVTYNGKTKSYGGAGYGGGKGINANQIKYWYSFDGSSGDAYLNRSMDEVSAMIREYGAMDVPEEPKDLPKLTWASVRQTVGKEGSYVRLELLLSVFGGVRIGYTFLFDNGSTGETDNYYGWGAIGAIGFFTNAWYDGRYFNSWEYYYPGVKFEETLEEEPDIIIKNASIKLPDDDRDYYYSYRKLDEEGIYNREAGVWSGFMVYRYDKASQTWKSDLLSRVRYKENGYKEIEDQDFIDACTITYSEALQMNLDANTDVEPTSYYIYDSYSEPGTYHGG